METVYDPQRGHLNQLFATAAAKIVEKQDNAGFPPLKSPAFQPFLVRNIFTDFKRHDVGPNFYERNYDGTVRKETMTTPLWGVGSSTPYGHDGRSINVYEVILRHGGEEHLSRDFYSILPPRDQRCCGSSWNR